MVEIADIRDRESLKAWLEDQPRAVSVWIAFRAAARVLPLWWDAVLREEWALERDLTALPVLRITLISAVAATAAQFRYSQTAYAAREAIYREITIASHGMRKRPSVEIMGLDSAISTVAAVAEVTYTEATAISGAASATETSTEVVEYASAVWTSVRADVEQVSAKGIPGAFALWPDGHGPLEDKWRAIVWQVINSDDAKDWKFWTYWYDSLLDGRPMLADGARTWEMLEKIVLIDPETWDKGPDAVNPVIREIWEEYRDSGTGEGRVSDHRPITDDAKSAMKQRVAVNRDALAVASAGLVDQLGAFRDHVRGMNHLEPEVREEVLTFIDEVTGKLSQLLEGLPGPGEGVDDAQAGRLVLWLREYRVLLRQKLAYYGSVENMAEATVPTGIILGATGIGAMMGMPVAGSVVGGLIVNQMKPGQAAKELTKPSGKESDTG
jgi:hypothetical protein